MRDLDIKIFGTRARQANLVMKFMKGSFKDMDMDMGRDSSVKSMAWFVRTWNKRKGLKLLRTSEKTKSQ